MAELTRIVAAASVALTIFSCKPESPPISPVLTLDRIDARSLSERQAILLYLRFDNPARTTFAYTGYEGGRPMIIVKQEIGGVWSVVHESWCGTGANDRYLGPGESVEFILTLGESPFDLSPRRTRIGVPIKSLQDDCFTSVWSEELDLAHIMTLATANTDAD